MKTIVLLAALAAGCGGGASDFLPSRASSGADLRGAPSTCVFGTNPLCGVTDCCEFDSTTHPGYREELVCCGAVGLLYTRICSCPGCDTPCGKAGKAGCAICGTPLPYSVSCNVHPQAEDGQPHSCGYVLDADD